MGDESRAKGSPLRPRKQTLMPRSQQASMMSLDKEMPREAITTSLSLRSAISISSLGAFAPGFGAVSRSGAGAVFSPEVVRMLSFVGSRGHSNGSHI